MANQIQKLQYEGYLGGDPDYKYLPNGVQVVNFRVASHEEYKDKETGEKIQKTTWLRCSAFRNLADIINQYCRQGSHVIVFGKLRPGPSGSPEVFTLSQSGESAASYDVTVQEIRILDKKNTTDYSDVDSVEDEDIPF